MGIGGIHRRGDDLDAAQVDLQLLGDQHGQRGPDPLPHLGLVHDDRDEVGLADADEGIRRELRRGRAGRGLGGGGGDGGEPEAEEEAAGQRGGGSQELAAGRGRGPSGRHRQPPFRIRAAASLMAARIRW
jgi:hypothetical protein